MGTAELTWASAISCAGRFNPAVFDTPDDELIVRHVTRDIVTRVLDAHFATIIDGFRAEDKECTVRLAGTTS